MAKVDKLVTTFSQLNNEEKSEFIDAFLDCCGSDQKWQLQQKLPTFLFRDFFTLLPDEVLEMVLSYLDCKTLLNARQVSKLWNSRLSSPGLRCIWQKLAKQLGAQDHLFDSINWIRACAYTQQLRSEIKEGSCFSSLSISEMNTELRDASVTSINVVGDTFILALTNHHSEEITDLDCLLLWSYSSQKPLQRLEVTSKVSVVKADSSGSVITAGHHNGSVTIYNLEEDGRRGRNFQAHSAGIFSLDICKKLKLVASGSADKTVMFWSLPDNSFVTCITDLGHWVVKVLLYGPEDHEVTSFSDKALLFSMTRDTVTLHAWTPENLETLSEPVYSIPLCIGKAFGFRDIFFTPGLYLYGDNLGFIRQMTMFETHTIGNADIVIANANDGKVKKTIHVNKKVRKLLGIGERFAMLLLPYVDNRYKNIVIVDLRIKKIIGGFTVPHSRPCTPDFGQIGIGDIKWLDGLSEETDQSKKVLIALATTYEHLHLVHWKNKK